MNNISFEPSFSRKNRKFSSWLSVAVALGCLLLVIVMIVLFQMFGSVRLSEEKRVTVPQGFSAARTAELLKHEGVIRSPFAFRFAYRDSSRSVKAGTYLFEPGQHNLSGVVHRLHMGDYGDVFVTVTLPEGITVREMAAIFANSGLTHFDQEKFLEETDSLEGYLFPDTYLLLPEVSTEDIIELLQTTFQRKIRDHFASAFEASSRSFEEIVIMASLIEREAGNSLEEQKMVAGILWKRFDRGMLLQVDAPFVYFQGKGSSQLTIQDLATDHPYNTYTRVGLTPTPIGNPGVSAVEAALFPESSPYFYYLHDSRGNIHYGVTHDDHVRNKQRYLR